MAEEEVGLRLALKNRREVQRGVHEVGDELDRTADQADRVNRKARIAAGGMLAFGKSGRIAGRAVVAGTGAAVAGLVGAGIVLTKLSKDSIGEAREAQKVGAVTRAEIKATGRAANVSARQVGDLSGAISEKVGIDDEAIQSGANMILTFKNVRNEVGKGNKIFNRATRSAVDLSAAGFGSITSQSKTLAKALNDPVKGLAALGKSGVTFTQSQQDSIKAMVKQGNLLGAQKVILGEVEAQVGGVAASQATWGEKASVSIGNIKESIGTALLPELDKVEKWFVTKGAPVLENYVGVFERRGIPKIREYAGVFEDRAIPAMKNLVDEGRPLVGEILPAAGAFLGTAADAFGVIAPKAEAVFKAFNGLPSWAKSAIAIGAGSAVAAKKLNLGSNIFSGVTAAKPLPVYVVNSGMPGGPGKTKNGTPIVTSDDRRNPRKRGRNAGRGVGGGLLAFLAMGNDDVQAVTNDPFGELGKELMWPWKEGPFKPKKWTGDAREMKTAQSDLNRVFQTGKVKGDDYALSLAGVGSALSGIPRDVRPRLTIDGLTSAEQRVNNLRTSLLGLSPNGSYGNGLGVNAPSSPTKKPKTKPRAPFPIVKPPVSGGSSDRVSAGTPEIHNHFYVDGNEITTSVMSNLETKLANQ